MGVSNIPLASIIVGAKRRLDKTGKRHGKKGLKKRASKEPQKSQKIVHINQPSKFVRGNGFINDLIKGVKLAAAGRCVFYKRQVAYRCTMLGYELGG
jgi:hypothetical protein